ncbi:MAG: hypothetical protein AAGA85_11205, partial [Bacteroidota bacterium]
MAPHIDQFRLIDPFTFYPMVDVPTKDRLWGRKKYLEKGLQILRVEAYAEDIATLQADTLIIDIELHECILCAHKLGIPCIVRSPWFTHLESPVLPPLFTNIIPGQGWKGSKVGTAFVWLILKLRIAKEHFANRLQGRINRRSLLVYFGKRIGFPTRSLVFSSFPPVFSYNSLLTLSMNLQQLEFPHKASTRYQYLGPMVLEEPPNSAAAQHEAVLTAATQKEEGRRIIYCTFGTLIEGDQRLLQALVDAIAERKTWTLIISSKMAPSRLQLSDNTFLFSYVPQKTLLSYCDCCIHHAGINTVNECIHFSVPMLFYNVGDVDKNGVTARFRYHDLAIIGNLKKDGPEDIAGHIEVLLGSSWKNKMLALQAKYIHDLGINTLL